MGTLVGALKCEKGGGAGDEWESKKMFVGRGEEG